MQLEKSYDRRYSGRGGGPSYPELAQDALLGNTSLSKACMMIKHHKAILKSRAESEFASRSFNLPQKITVLNRDSTKLDEIPELKDNSIDLIFADPVYIEGSLPLIEALPKLASTKLKEGASLVFYYGIPWEPEIHRTVAKYENLKWWWRLSVYHEGAQARRVHTRGVRVHGKPLMWFVKGEKKLITNSDIKDFIFSKKADKTKHPWAQSTVEAEYVIKNLTISEHSLVVDPFLGSGTFGIPAIKLNRWFIGIEIDKQVCEFAENNLKNEAAKIVKYS